MDSPKIALGKYVAIWKLTVKSGANLAGKCHIYFLIYNQPHVNWYANVALPFLLQICIITSPFLSDLWSIFAISEYLQSYFFLKRSYMGQTSLIGTMTGPWK